MHIEKLEIKGFGKLKASTLEFKKGLNIIYGKNESGKTTLQQFIKGMLYGLRGGRRIKGEALSPLKRFEPWVGDEYGGAIEYRLDSGERYRVERDFNSGITRVFDRFYNDITASFPAENRGKEPLFAENHLRLTKACFEKTILIGQMDLRIDGEGGRELQNRLINVRETGFDDISFRKAEKELKDALKINVGTDRTSIRPMDKVIKRLEELNEKRSSLYEKQCSFLSIEKELKEALLRKGRIEESKRLLEKEKELLETARSIIEVKEKKIGLIELAGDIRAEEENLRHTALVLEKLKEEISRLRLAKDGKRPERRSAGWILSSAAVIFALAAAASAFYGLFADKRGFAVSGAAVLGVLVCFLIKSRKSAKRIVFIGEQDALDALNRKHEDGMHEIIKLNNGLKDMFAKASLVCGEHIIGSKELDKAIEKISSTLAVLDRTFGAIQDEIRYNDSGLTVPVFADGKPPFGLTDFELGEMESLWDFNNGRINEEFQDMVLKIKECETLIKSLQDDEDMLQRVDEEIEELTVKRKELEDIDASLRIAFDLLTEAGTEIQKDFAPDLNNMMSTMIDRISGGRYGDLRADSSLSLKLIPPETGNVADAMMLSAGTIDQVYFALRLSMAELLTSGHETLPLIMDETFAQYDDERTRHTLEFLKERYPDRQILLFTCKDREIDIARDVYGELEVGSLRLEVG